MPAKCTLTWTGRDDWFKGGKPKPETLTIPAGKTIKRTYRINPGRQGTAPPVLTVRYEITAEGRTVHRTRKLPLQVVATLTAARVEDITIDGKLDDWSDVPAHVSNTRERAKYKPYNWSGPEDCSFTTKIGYDDKNLYLAVDVTDDVIVTEGRNPWDRDGVMVFWDPRGPETRAGKFTDPCRELMISVPAGSDKASVESWPKNAALVSAVSAACRKHKGGYAVELAIPLSAVGKNFKPAAGGESRLSLEVRIDDKDKTAAKTTISYMVLSGGNNAYRSTVGYAVVKFQ